MTWSNLIWPDYVTDTTFSWLHAVDMDCDLSLVYIMIVSHDSSSHDSKMSWYKRHFHLLSHYRESTLILVSQRRDSNQTITHSFGSF